MNRIKNLVKTVFIILTIVLAFQSKAQNTDKKSVCFYYHDNPPSEMYSLCDWLIVNPNNKNVYKKAHSKLFAYISIGEISRDNPLFKSIKKEWIIGENKNWNTVVLDISNPEYREFLLNTVLPRYRGKYYGFFFDTVDSYNLAIKDLTQKEEYERGLVEFFKEVKGKYPDKKIIINRGFEVFDYVKNYIDGVVVESLYYGLDLKNNGYREITEQERNWLLPILNKIKDNGKMVIVIDYLPPKEKEKAFKDAKQIEKLGFIPYITNKEVNIIGTSYFQLIPRKILILYDKRACPVLMECGSAHYMASLIAEYYGYVPFMVEVNTELPPENDILVDEYAGIISWVNVNEVENPQKYIKWITSKIKEGNRVLFIDGFGFPLTNDYLKPLGLRVFENNSNSQNFKIAYKDKHIGFESEPFLELKDRLIINLDNKNFEPLLVWEDEKGQKTVPLALTDWGGYGLYGNSTFTIYDRSMWVVDPFYFFKKGLNIPYYPVPDTTTKNGRRILFAHIDGDGFIEPLEYQPKKFSAESIRDEFIKKYRIPHTVSIIEGEIAPYGAYPKLPHDRLEKIARSIFALDNVELASHSFTHPLKWMYVFKSGKIVKGYNLPAQNYKTFDLKREILGSVEYIDKKLAPEGKKTKVMLWTGDCNPPWQAVKLCYENGLLNMNGGDTGISKREPYLSLVSPLGIDKHGYFQVYAPFQNENYYTNEWKGPYFAFRNVIQAFELTEHPRRLKPIDIYYHFYSASKYASKKALDDVYRWAMKQETTPIFASEYIKSVLDFRKMAIAYDGKGWILKGNGDLTTLRFKGNVKPDLAKSKGVIGYKYDPRQKITYIHLDSSGEYYIILSHKGVKTPLPYIYDFNGIVEKFQKKENVYRYRLNSYVPSEIRFAGLDRCNINILERKDYKREKSKDLTIFKFKNGGVINIEIFCR